MDLKLVIILVHLIGVILGVGSSITLSFLFFRAIKDRKITHEELDLLEVVLRALWSGFLIALLSGLSFFVLQYLEEGAVSYLSSELFLGKLTIFFFLYLLSLIFHYRVHPLLRIACKEDTFREAIEKHTTLFSFVGATTSVAWIYILVLATFRGFTPEYMNYEKVIELFLVLSLLATLFTYYLLRPKQIDREML